MTRNTSQEEVLYGIHPVSAALTAGRRAVRRLYVCDTKTDRQRQQKIIALAQQAGVKVEQTSDARLAMLTDTGMHQGVAVRVGPYPFVKLEDLLTPVDNRAPLFLIIDGVTDPHNLGALLRTAVCADFQGVVVPKNNTASPTPVTAKTSAGAQEFIRIAKATNIARTVDFMKENGIWIAGLAAESGQLIYESDLTGPLALVLGSEGKGIRRLVKEKCDFLMAIPQAAVVDSLNVSVAGGIAMYEIYRQRTMTTK